MVLTAAKVTAFFTDPLQMGLVAQRTRVQLGLEGINSIEDLAEFTDEDTWKQIVENFKRPPQIPDDNGVLVNQQPFHIAAKSLHRLRVAAVAVEYYLATGRALTAQMVQWETQLKNFEVQWKSITSMSKNDSLELPKMSKTVGIVKWIEAYESYASQKIGVRSAPLAYVIRESEHVAAAPALAGGQPHSDEHGSVKDEMIARLSHNHPLFRDDNATVFDDVETATRGTKFAPSIAPFKRARDGRGAFLALKEQHAGPAMWDKEAKTSIDFLINRKFTGGTSTTLERYLSQHRAAYVSLQRCAENVQIEIPNQRSRVGYLIENIEVADPDVKAAIAAIKLDDSPTGLRNDFERAVALLLPTDPVAKKQKGKRSQAEISSANLKEGRGKTGVELRYYTPAEYRNLTDEQRKELRSIRSTKSKTGGKGGSDSSKGGSSSKFRVALVEQVKKELREEEDLQASRIDAIAGILRPFVGSTGGGAKTVRWTTDGGAKTAGNGKGQPDTVTSGVAESAEVAATKLYGLLQTMTDDKKPSARKGTKGGKKSG